VWDRKALISPAARLTFVHFFGREFVEVGGTAHFALSALALDLCPLRIGNDVVGTFVCGSFIAGALRAEGRDTSDAKAEELAWLVAGGTLLVEVRPVEPLELSLFGTAGSPLVRNSFQFGCPPDVPDCRPNVFHVVPKLNLQAGIALGVFFR
jgi:hypothetical protein